MISYCKNPDFLVRIKLCLRPTAGYARPTLALPGATRLRLAHFVVNLEILKRRMKS
jgi:hypothetical protein